MRAFLALGAMVAAAVLAPSPAGASFPGANGLLAVTQDTCQGIGHAFIQAFTEDGRPAHAITPECDRIEGWFSARDTFGPDWSPDGKRLLYVDLGRPGEPLHMETAAADGSDPREVGPLAFGGSIDVEPSFAPDGRRYAYVQIGRRIMVAPGDGRPARTFRRMRYLWSVRWSPDGRWLAVARTGSGGRTGLFLVSARAGKIVRRLTRHLPLRMDWSPDGRRLVFATLSWRSGRRTRGGDLYVVRADGRGRARRILKTEHGAAVSPAWSPDGRSIAWAQVRHRGASVLPSLWRKPVKGGRPRKLADLRQPRVEQGHHTGTDIAWQPLPRR